MYKLCTYNRKYNKHLLFIDQEIINFVARYQQENQTDELLNLPKCNYTSNAFVDSLVI